MQHLEPPIRPLTTKCDLVQHERCRQIGQSAADFFGPSRDPCLWQTPRQGQMKPKLFHHVGITPLQQQRVLPRAQPGGASARQFGRVGRGAKRVKITNTGLRNALHTVRFPLRAQGQKAAQKGQFQAITDSRRQRCRKLCRGLFQIGSALRVDQPKWWLQSAMKTIPAGCHGDVMQTRHEELAHLLAAHHIPTQPRCAEIGQGSFGRKIVNCKSRE